MSDYSFSANEVSTLVEILEAVAAGTPTPSQKATAAGLAARFRGQPAPPANGGTPPAPEAATKIDHVAIYAKRREAVLRAMAANPAAALRNRGE